MSVNTTREKTTDDDRAGLMQERELALRELGKLHEFMQSEVDIDPEEGDTEVSEREKNAALISVIKRKIKDVDAALSALDKGLYGICQRCENGIEPERLEIKPDATHCVSCQREIERLAKRRR